jgi:predicted amidophosphoribosyltransferase
MTISKCPRCGKMFNKVAQAKLCQICFPEEEKDYEKVREVIARDPNLNVEQASKESGVAVEVVQRMLDEGLIESQSLTGGEQVACGRCGKPAISRSKRLCQDCLTKLNAQVAMAQMSMRRPPKKDVQVDATGLNVRRTLEQKKTK